MFTLKFLVPFLLLGFSFLQPAGAQTAFLQNQKSSARVSKAFMNTESRLQQAFIHKGLRWPASFMYIRSFKFDSKVEIWLKNERTEKYKLFKTYRVCMQSGSMGPKRLQGDFQIPEGFYYINQFNPNSMYHLSLGLNYPNASDKVLSDSMRPGGDIFIHGSCVSVGCVAVSDEDIEEIYTLAAHARAAGQEYIPVHIFPINYKVEKSAEFLEGVIKNTPSLKPFFEQLRKAFDLFEKNHQVPVVMVGRDGDYLFSW